MKNNLLMFFVIALSVGNSLYAQFCPQNTVTTNPDIRNHDGDNTNDVWDWRHNLETEDPYYDVKIHNSSTTQIISPFYVNHFSSVSNPNVTDLSEALPEDIDYKPEDGWELVYKDFGLNSANGIKYPFFVLYNRYESKLRYFFFMEDQPNADIDYTRIHFKTDDGTESFINTSLEHIYTPMDVIKNYYDKNPLIETPNKYMLNNQLWVMADVPIAYDPCTCVNTTKYEFANKILNIQNFTMTLEGGGEITQVFNDNPSGPGDVTNGFNIDDISSAITKGNKSYSKLNGAIGDLEKNLVKFVNSDFIIRQRLRAQGIDDNVSIDDLKTWSQLPPNHPISTAISAYAGSFFPKEILPGWIKDIVPYAGYITGIIDLFTGGGKPKPTPMRYNAELSFKGSGEIVDEQELQSNEIYVPGSKLSGQTQDGLVPVYNNVMGTMALMEQPILETAIAGADVVIKETEFGDVWSTSTYSGAMRTYKLKNPLKIALNPASGLEIKEMKAAFKLGTMGSDYYDDYISCQDEYECVMEWNPEEMMLDGVDDLIVRTGGENGTQFTYSTPYLPLECLTDYSFGTPRYSLGSFSSPVLHLIVKLGRKDNPNAKDVIYSATYEVRMENASYSYTETPPNPFSDVPWDAITDDIDKVLDGSVVAWNNILVKSEDVYVTEENAKLFYSEETGPVIIHPSDGSAAVSIDNQYLHPAIGTHISGPVIVHSQPKCNSKLVPVGKEYLKSFCTDHTRYYPVSARYFVEPPRIDNEDTRIITKVYPNPVSDILRLECTFFDTNNEISISIVNSFGKKVVQMVDKKTFGSGKHVLSFSLFNLPAGIYFVTLNSRIGREIHKIIKI